MTHPMAPPPEQCREWINQANALFPSHSGNGLLPAQSSRLLHVAQLAYAAGADAELEACLDRLENYYGWRGTKTVEGFRALRRPAPLNPQQQAINACANALAAGRLSPDEAALIRNALETKS